jgi:hypothetical protein
VQLHEAFHPILHPITHPPSRPRLLIIPLTSHLHVPSLVEARTPSCLRRGTRVSIIPSSFLHSLRNMPIGGVDWYLRTCSSISVGSRGKKLERDVLLYCAAVCSSGTEARYVVNRDGLSRDTHGWRRRPPRDMPMPILPALGIIVNIARCEE